MRWSGAVFAIVVLAICPPVLAQYFRSGQAAHVRTAPVAGYALMGGGADLDPAFQWLCEHAPGGGFLILRARGKDDYDAYVNGLCHANSVATLIIADATAAKDPKTAEIIRNAEAIFIAGGDQARYVKGWTDTPVQAELRNAAAVGVPMGGTSAGLAVLGQYVYSAENDKPDDPNLSSSEAMANPFTDQVIIRRNFLDIPVLRNVITDTHSKARDRMGRTLVFLARIVQDGWDENPRAIGVDEKTAVLVNADGKAAVVGASAAYFLRVTEAPRVCRAGVPLTFDNVSVYRVPVGGQFDLSIWKRNGRNGYSLSVAQGVIRSSQSGGDIY
jgi:cyanophycinase